MFSEQLMVKLHYSNWITKTVNWTLFLRQKSTTAVARLFDHPARRATFSICVHGFVAGRG